MLLGVPLGSTVGAVAGIAVDVVFDLPNDPIHRWHLL
jgi:hypothetical protein